LGVSGPGNPAETVAAWQSGDVSEQNELQTIAAIAIGGVVGSTARWAVGTQLAPDGTDGFPLYTFVVNVIGCLLIGLAASRVARPSIAWAFLATGVLGGFTTMSGFAVQLNDLAEAGETTTMVLYLAATLAGGFAALIGAERLSGHTGDDPEGIE
jgi:CrcB protein